MLSRPRMRITTPFGHSGHRAATANLVFEVEPKGRPPGGIDRAWRPRLLDPWVLDLTSGSGLFWVGGVDVRGVDVFVCFAAQRADA
jgi:hypothetical protein